MADQAENMPDIEHGLDALTETTTPAELMKRRGQRTKLRTINKDKLKQWIEQAIGQARAGMANQYDDREKEELLKKTQDQLEDLMARAAKAEAAVREREERDAVLQEEIEQLRAVQVDESASSAEMERAMATIDQLTKQREEAQNEADDLRADLYQVQDQLNEKLALLQTTIDEKDKLNATMKELMGNATDLVGGVLGLDNDYYGSRHQNENELGEDADPNAYFYHDYEVGAKVIETLSADLGRLREITKQQEAQEASGSQPMLLDKDLELLAQLKAGNLSAVDTAEPVANLCEALEGARSEAISSADAAGEIMGMDVGSHTVSAVPDPDAMSPEEALAGCTAVVRELAASFMATKGRLAAMKAIADDADQARGSSEDELGDLATANERLLAAIGQQAEQAGLTVPSSMRDENVPVDQRAAAAEALVEQFAGAQSKAVEAQALGSLARQLQQALAADERSSFAAAEVTEADDDLVLDEEPAAEADAASGDALAAVQRQVTTLVQELASAKAALETSRSRESSLLSTIQSMAHQRQEQPAVAARDDFKHATAKLDAVVIGDDEADEEAHEAAAEVVRILAETSAAEEDDGLAVAIAAAAKKDEVLATDASVQELDEAATSGAPTSSDTAKAVVEAMGRRIEELSQERDELADKAQNSTLELTGLKRALEAGKQREASLLSTIQTLAHQGSPAVQAAAGKLDQALTEESEDGEEQAVEAAKDLVRVLAESNEGEDGEALAVAILAAAKKDEELAANEAVQQLEQGGDEADAAASAETVKQVVEAMGERIEELVRERDDMALSGKEVISQLTEQRAARDAELDDLRGKLRGLDRMNREYIEAVSEMAEVAETVVGDNEESPLKAAAQDLTAALEAMPGDDDVAIDDEAAQRMVAASKQLVQSFKAEMDQVVQDLQAGSKEIIEVLNQRSAKLGEENEQLQADLAENKTARVTTEAAGRDLAETVAGFAESQDAGPEVSEACADLEALLSDEAAGSVPLNEIVIAAKRVIEVMADGATGAKAKAQIADLEQRLQAAEAQQVEAMSSLQNERSGLEQELQETMQEVQTVRADLEAAQNTVRDLQDQLADDQHQIKTMRDELEVTIQERDKLKEEAEEQKLSMDNLRQENSAVTSERDRLREKVEKLTAEQEAEAAAAQAAASERLTDLETQLETEQVTSAALRDELDEAQKTQAAQATELEELRSLKAANEESLSELQTSLDDQREALEAERATLATLREEHEAASSERDQLREELTQVRGELEAIQATAAEELVALKADQEQKAQQQAQQLDEMMAERRALEERVEAAEAKLAEQNEAGERMAAQLEEARAKAQEVEASFSGAQENLAALEEERDDLRRQRDEAQEAKDSLTAQLDQVREAREIMEGELADALEAKEAVAAELEQLRENAETLEAEMVAIRAERARLDDSIADIEAERDKSKALLKDARAALEEYRARDAESASGKDEHVSTLKERIAALQSERDNLVSQQETELEDQRIENAALRQRLTELQNSIVGRDEQILDLKDQLDNVGDVRVSNEELRAKVDKLAGDLNQATSRTRELEQQVNDLAGGTGRAGGLQEELKLLQSEREQLLARVRSLEDDLAVEKGRVTGLTEAREKQRESFEEERVNLQAQIEVEAEAKEQVEEQLRQLKSDLAGAQARIRTLTSVDDED